MTIVQEIALIRAQIAKLEAEIEALSDVDENDNAALVSEWSSVKDALPEHYGYYLVTIGSEYRPFVTVMKYDTHEKAWLNPFNQRITYWMPYPEPAREGDKDDSEL